SSLSLSLIGGVLLMVLGGCAVSAAPPVPPAKQTARPDRSKEWKAWRYPNELGHGIMNGGDPYGRMVVYTTATSDSFHDVLTHYETLGGIEDLSNPESGGGLSEHRIVNRTHAVRTGANFSRPRGQRSPNQSTFAIRTPDHA